MAGGVQVAGCRLHLFVGNHFSGSHGPVVSTPIIFLYYFSEMEKETLVEKLLDLATKNPRDKSLKEYRSRSKGLATPSASATRWSDRIALLSDHTRCICDMTETENSLGYTLQVM